MKPCEVCTKDIHRSSFAKHLKSELHIQNEVIIPPNFFHEVRLEPRAVPTSKTLARGKINLSNRELEKEVAKPL